MDCQLLVYAYLSDRAVQDKKDADCKDSCDMWSGIFGPVFLTTGIFAMVAGVIVFIAVFRILYEKEPHGVCYCMIVCVVLEVVLYVSSNFIHDYTRFNLYFLIDFVLTIVNMLLLPCTVWEVSRDDVY